MSEVTRILGAIEAGDVRAASDLLPLVYAELRAMAAAQMARESPGHTLQATALVHEAYLRLVGPADQPRWKSQMHFYSAAAESMRRILIEASRRRKAAKRGGQKLRSDLDPDMLSAESTTDELLALDEALERLAKHDPRKAELVKLRYFAGCTLDECAKMLNISPREADRAWAYAKSWLKLELHDLGDK